MVTETATISAATATAVRLSAPDTLRGAIRPMTPKTRRGEAMPRRKSKVSRSQQGEADGEEEDAPEADDQTLS